MDEASILRNKKNRVWGVIQVIPKLAIGLCTATATQNNIKDLQGLAMLIFVTSDLPKVGARGHGPAHRCPALGIAEIQCQAKNGGPPTPR